MTTFKTTSGNLTYNIAPNVSGNGLGTFTVNGNLVIRGTQTTSGANVVSNPFITVAANNVGTLTDMGMIAQKTSNTFAGFRFDTTANTWQISSSVLSTGDPIAPYANILTYNSAAGSNTQIQYNNDTTFGASAALTFDFANNVLGVAGKISLVGSQLFVNTPRPTNIANTVAIYSNVIGVGGTGLYFTSNVANGELISKNKAIVYSLIF
jgi:hypothetical protein